LFTEGLVKNKEGEWEYNIAEFNSRKSRNKLIEKHLRDGNLEEARKLSETQPEYIKADESFAKDDTYSRRIDAIMEANKRNQSLKWAINEVANGDAVNKMMLTLADERKKQQSKQQKKEEKADKIEEQSSRDPFDVYKDDTKVEQQEPVTQDQPSENDKSVPNEKYERRKKRVKDFFDRQRKKYDKFTKGTLKSGIPF
jgi:hypothetical protein